MIISIILGETKNSPCNGSINDDSVSNIIAKYATLPMIKGFIEGLKYCSNNSFALIDLHESLNSLDQALRSQGLYKQDKQRHRIAIINETLSRSFVNELDEDFKNSLNKDLKPIIDGIPRVDGIPRGEELLLKMGNDGKLKFVSQHTSRDAAIGEQLKKLILKIDSDVKLKFAWQYTSPDAIGSKLDDNDNGLNIFLKGGTGVVRVISSSHVSSDDLGLTPPSKLR